MKQTIKTALAALFYYLGVFGVYHCIKLKLRHRAIILMYHRVLPDVAPNAYPVQPGMYVTQSTFNKHILFLKKKFDIISFPQLLERIKERENVGNTCCITFDDGWRDNYQYAFPILEKYSVPATIFLTTGYIGTEKCFWTDELSYYLQFIYNDRNCYMKLPDKLKTLFQRCGIDRTDNIHTFIDTVIGEVKESSAVRPQEVVSLLKDNFTPFTVQQQLLTWEEVREMQGSGLVYFGAHTVNHVLLDQLTPPQALSEISDSIQHVMNEVWQETRLFAYPNGNFNNEIKNLLREVKVDAAVTTRRGYLDHNTNLLEIPRIGLHNDISASPAQLFWRILVR